MRNKDGEDYEPDSLRVMIAALDRHLKEHGYKQSIARRESQTTSRRRKRQASKQGKKFVEGGGISAMGSS